MTGVQTCALPIFSFNFPNYIPTNEMGLMNVINYIPAIGYVSCGPMVHTNILLKVFVLFLGDKPMKRESKKAMINTIAKS